MKDYFYKLPKAELHIHIEGALEPELLLRFAERNKIALPYATVEDVQAAYRFSNLQEFLDLSAECQQVLRTDQDFYELMLSYATKAHKQGVVHAEIFFELQSYKKVAPASIIEGLKAGIQEAQKRYTMSLSLLLCFLRNLPQESAFQALQHIVNHLETVVGVGLAGPELNNPPKNFGMIFKQARELGLRTTVHAGEEGPSEYVKQAIDLLHVDRVDHALRALDNSQVVATLVTKHIPVTVCPLSNVELHVVPALSTHPIRRMLQAGLSISINSDDPAYFGSYCGDNYQVLAQSQVLSAQELVACARSSFASSFLAESEKKAFIKKLDEFCRNHAPQNF